MPVRSLFILFCGAVLSHYASPVLYCDAPHKNIITWFLRMINCLSCWNILHLLFTLLSHPPYPDTIVIAPPFALFPPFPSFSLRPFFYEKVNNIEEIKIHYLLSGIYRALCRNNRRGGKQKSKKTGRRGGTRHRRKIIMLANGWCNVVAIYFSSKVRNYFDGTED